MRVELGMLLGKMKVVSSGVEVPRTSSIASSF